MAVLLEPLRDPDVQPGDGEEPDRDRREQQILHAPGRTHDSCLTDGGAAARLEREGDCISHVRAARPDGETQTATPARTCSRATTCWPRVSAGGTPARFQVGLCLEASGALRIATIAGWRPSLRTRASGRAWSPSTSWRVPGGKSRCCPRRAPCSAFSFAAGCGVPAAELANRSVPLEQLIPRARAEEVTGRIAAAPDDASRVALVERFLRELPFARDPLVTRALERLSDPNGSPSLAAIAAELALSERQLERRFLRRVGMMPKRFARLARFQRAVSLMDSEPALAAVAQHAGYYDQSHFVREFRAFAGTPPAAWRGRR